MGSLSHTLKELVTPSRRAGLLVAGDAAILVVFAILGRRTHDEATGFAAALAVLGTVLPFVLGWLAAAPLLGALRGERTRSLPAMVERSALAWLGAFPIAVAIRALALGRFSPWTFYVVAFTVPLLMLLAWRTVFALAERRFATRAAAPR